MRCVSPRNGETYQFRLDPTSHENLQEAGQLLANQGVEYSASVIVRAAIRHYFEHLQTLETAEDREHERIQLNRAQKGQ